MGHNPSPATGNPATMSPIATVIARFLTRLSARADRPEFEHAVIRLMFASAIVVFFALEISLYLAGPRVGLPQTEQVLAIGLVGFCLIAVGILAAIYFWPAKSVTRRIVGMLSDVGLATLWVWLAGENGMWMIGVYLILIFGNGFRYGHRYLFGCQSVCLMGFAAAGFLVPYWQQHQTEWMALLVTIIMVPLYVSILLKRIAQAHARTKAALKECLEHHPV